MDTSCNLPFTSSNCQIAKSLHSNHAKFISTYNPHQSWSLPDTMIYSISMNPSTAKVYDKLIQSCKYFIIKKPILIVPTLRHQYKDNEWHTQFNEKNVSITNILTKIWITDNFYFYGSKTDKQNFLTSLIPKIYQIDVKKLYIRYQNLCVNDLLFLGSKCENVFLSRVTVLDEDGEVMVLEKIVEILPNVKEFKYSLGQNGSQIITSKTAAELIKLPNFANLQIFKLRTIPESFEIDTFYDYMKKNKKTKILLHFRCSAFDQGYTLRLLQIFEEVRVANNHDQVISLFF